MTGPNSRNNTIEAGKRGYVHRRRGIFFHTAVLFFLLTFIIVSIFAFAVIPWQRNSIIKNLESHTRSVSASIAQICGNAIVNKDYSFIVDHVLDTIQGSPDILYILVVRNDGFTLAHTSTMWEQREKPDPKWEETQDSTPKWDILYNKLVQKKVFHHTSPLYFSGIDWGWIHIGLSLKGFNKDIKTMYKRLFALGLFCLVISAVGSYFFAKRLTNPLISLRQVTKRISEGDLTARVEISTGDEMEDLAKSFNKMTSDLQRSRDEIISAKEYTQNIMRSMLNTLVVVSPEGIIQRVNRATCDLLGYEEKELLGQQVTTIFTEEELLFKKTGFADLIKEGFVANVEKTCLTKDGRKIPVLFSCSPMRKSDGKIQAVVCVAQDITERKRAECEVAKRVKRLQKVSELSMTLAGDPVDVFKKAAYIIGELLDVHVVCLSEIRGDELYFLSVYVDGEVMIDAGYCRLDITPCATVEESKDMRVYDHVAERFPEASFLKMHNAFSYCGFPSFDSDGNVVAVNCLLDDKPHDFSEEDKGLMRIFGQRIGMEIERQRHLNECKQAEEALAERARLGALGTDIGVAFTQEETLQGMMQQCCESFVKHLNVAFARLWMLNKEGNILELQVSVGMYAGIDDPPLHSSIPVGEYTVGLIAKQCQPYQTNKVIGNPHIRNQEWAKREGLVAFAGHPLIVEDRVIGVMAIFSREPLKEITLKALASVADELAIGIERKRTEEALKRTVAERDQGIEELRHLMAFSTIISEKRSEEEMIEYVSSFLKAYFSIDVFALIMLSMEGKELEVRFVDPLIPTEKLISKEAILNPTTCRVIRTGKEYIKSDTNKEKACECLLCESIEGEHACFPLAVGGKTIGAVLMVKKERGYWENDEMLGLITTYLRIAVSVIQRVRLIEISRLASITDGLTGAYNRRFFNEMLENQMALAKRYDEPLCLMIADIDHFKKLNDTYGHMAGDLVLQQATKVMGDSLRSSDTLARYGGEEFVIIMPKTDLNSAIDKAEKIRQSIESTAFENGVQGTTIIVTLSIGVASFPEQGTDYDTLVQAADKALYKAKEGGRNRVEVS